MSLVLGWDPSNGRDRNLFGMKNDPSEEVLVRSLLSGYVPLSGYEDGFSCVIGTQYYWELSVVDPSSFPVYFGLHGSEPWISEDCFLFPEFGEVES